MYHRCPPETSTVPLTALGFDNQAMLMDCGLLPLGARRQGGCGSSIRKTLPGMVGEIVGPMPWKYRADPPQRFSSNYRRYLERGGAVRFEEDVAGFVATGRIIFSASRWTRS
jgi:hypothetical protein